MKNYKKIYTYTKEDTIKIVSLFNIKLDIMRKFIYVSTFGTLYIFYFFQLLTNNIR